MIIETKTKSKAFTLTEVLVALFMVSMCVVMLSQCLTAVTRINRNNDLSLRILTQNINTVEYLKDNVKTDKDLWKLFLDYK